MDATTDSQSIADQGGDPAYEQQLDAIIALRWGSFKRLGLAMVFAGYPFLFILDGMFDLPISPVVPGLIALAILWIIVPHAMLEVWNRRPPIMAQARKRRSRTKFALVLSIAWFLFWLVFLV